MVPDPFLAENLVSETVIQRLSRMTRRVSEAMRGRAQAHDWLAGLDMIEDQPDLVLRQFPPSEIEDGQVGGFQRFQPLHVLVALRRRTRVGHRNVETISL